MQTLQPIKCLLKGKDVHTPAYAGVTKESVIEKIKALCERPQCFNSLSLPPQPDVETGQPLQCIFDVRRAWQMVVESAREPELMLLDNQMLKSAKVDPEHCAKLTDTELMMPLLAGQVGIPGLGVALHVLDGWHRIVRVVQDGYNSAEVFVLTQEEMEEVRFKSVRAVVEFQTNMVRQNPSIMDPVIRRGAKFCGCTEAELRAAVNALLSVSALTCEIFLAAAGVESERFAEFIDEEMGGAML